jgi:hypothetical protein
VSNEVGVDYTLTGQTLYFQVRDAQSGLVWNLLSGAFEVYGSLSGNLNSYANSLTEQGTASRHYRGNFPSNIRPGKFDVTAKVRPAAFYAETDTSVAVGDIQWAGSGGPVRALSDLTTSGQMAGFLPIKLTKGVSVSGWLFKLVSSSDHVSAVTSGTPISGQISQNGGSFGSLQSGTLAAGYAEIGLGWYRLNTLTSGDLNADSVILRFQTAGSDPREMTIYTQP